MSHRMQGKRRRVVSDWDVQPLEGRVLLSHAGSAPGLPAEVASVPGQVRTSTSIQASTQLNAIRPTVKLVAAVEAPGLNRPVGVGVVRFSVVSPTPENLGSVHTNSRGTATLNTMRLIRGETYVIQAQYIPPSSSIAPSSAQLDVPVGEPPAASFRITAPQYFGAPGTPLSYTVTALDRAGQVVTDYAGTIAFVSPTDHAAKFLDHTYTFTAADQGVHEFYEGITFHKGGAEVLKLHQINNTQVTGSQVFGIE